MSRHADQVIDKQYNRPISGCQIYVYDSTGALATITADGGSALANPFAADIYGNYAFNVAVDGIYRIEYWAAFKLVYAEQVIIGTPAIFQGLPGPKGDPGTLAGNITGLASVTTLAALGALTGQAAGDARYLSAPGLEGTFVYKLGDYSVQIAADTLKGIFVTASGIATTVGAWVRQYDTYVNVKWWGAKGDDVTDDYPAFKGAENTLRALASLKTGNTRNLPRLWVPVPPKGYYLGQTWNIHNTMYIVGENSGQPASNGTTLRFPLNQDGIIINHFVSDGRTTASNLGDAGGTTIEGLTLFGGTAASVSGPFKNSATNFGCGITVRAISCVIRDCWVGFFAEDGINVHADSGGAVQNAGNANSVFLERVWSTYNGGHGFNIYGTDANAGVFMQCSSVENAGAGYRDYSFLGNTYIMCHTRGNGGVDAVGNGTRPTGACKYPSTSPSFYYVAVGQEAAASTTTPGTNSAVWVPWSGGYTGLKLWVSCMTWTVGSSYATNPGNVNAYCGTFISCYAEQTQPPAQATYPTLFLGGLFPDGFTGSAGLLQGGSGCVIAPGFLSQVSDLTLNPSNKYTILGNKTGLYGPDTLITHNDGTRNWRIWSYSSGALLFERNGQIMFDWTANGLDFRSGYGVYNQGNQVVGARQTGWTAATGTPLRGAFAAAAAGTASAAYVQSEAQSDKTRIAALEARLIALEADLRTHGLIN